MGDISNYDTNTHRAAFTVNRGGKKYMYAVFKKSKQGVKTSQEVIQATKQRIKWLKQVW